MTSLIVLLSVCMLVPLLHGAEWLFDQALEAKAEKPNPLDENAELTPEAERLRLIIQGHTGREVAAVSRNSGLWFAKTAKGWETVDALLRGGRMVI